MYGKLKTGADNRAFFKALKALAESQSILKAAYPQCWHRGAWLTQQIPLTIASNFQPLPEIPTLVPRAPPPMWKQGLFVGQLKHGGEKASAFLPPSVT